MKPDYISGVSAGAIAGVFLASGRTPREAFEVLKKEKIFNNTRVRWPDSGFFRLSGFQRVLEENIETDDLKDLEIPFYATISNLNKGRVEYPTDGPLHDIVLASSSIPVLFAPVNLGDDLYVDGGLFDNLPVYPLRQICDTVIAVSMTPTKETQELSNLLRLATRVFHLGVKATAEQGKRECDLLIEPMDIARFDIINTNHADEMFQLGYEHTMALELPVKAPR